MANALYAKAKEAFLNGDIDLAADDIRVIMVDNAEYTVNIATDNALDDIAAGARVAVSTALAGKTTTDGVFDAADKTITGVTGDPTESLVLYKHTGVESTSLLIAYIDTGTNITFTPNGGDVEIAWHASGILAL